MTAGGLRGARAGGDDLSAFGSGEVWALRAVGFFVPILERPSSPIPASGVTDSASRRPIRSERCFERAGPCLTS
jgi:hypothetical protein